MQRDTQVHVCQFDDWYISSYIQVIQSSGILNESSPLHAEMQLVAYETIRSTATEFIHSLDETNDTLGVNEDRIRAIRSAKFKHSWGHKYMTTCKPGIAQTLDTDGFVEHLRRMLPALAARDSQIQNIWIDELRQTAVVRVMLFLTTRRASEQIQQDMLWILEMDESGKQVDSAIEFLDGSAVDRLRELAFSTRDSE